MKVQIKAFNGPLEAVHKAHALGDSQAVTMTGLGREPSMQSSHTLDQNYNNLVHETGNGADIQMLRNSLNKAVRK